MKGLLLLYGECFRDGHHNSGVTDTPTSYLPQKEASLSHVAFCDAMKKKGVHMDVLIHTYPTKYEKDLRSWYTYPTTYYEKKRYPFKNSANAIASFMRIAKKIDRSYDFVLFTRLDILLKPTVHTLINPSWDKIYFFSQEFTGCEAFVCGFYEGNIPAVNPILEFIPKRFFHVLDHIDVHHTAWRKYYNLGIKELDFMVEEYYDADTYLDYNPYYKMANRPETHIHFDKGKKIDRTLFYTNKKIKCKTKKFKKF
jgi:hypothetical protein